MGKQFAAAVVLAAAVFGIGSDVQAQEVVTATLFEVNSKMRDPETVTTPEVQRSEIPNVEGQYVRVRLTMSVNDAQDPTITTTFRMYEFVASRGGWIHVSGGALTGSVNINPETGQQYMPRIEFHPSMLHPEATAVRFEIGWNKRINVGLVAETFID